MVAPVGRPAYLEQLHALMPRGRAWPHHRASVLSQLLDPIAAQLARVDQRGAGLLDDLLASRTSALLTDWETDQGLPDSCSALASTPADRRAAVIGKLVAQPDLSPSSFEAIGRLFGVTLTVAHLDQARADLIPNLDTTGGRWRFVWWIEIPTTADIQFFTMSSDVGTPLSKTERNTELECRLQKASPAHTHLVIGYVAPGNQPPTAAAGADQNVAAGVRVTLDGSASSDPDGTIASYAWAQVSGDNVALTDDDTATPEFDAPSTGADQTLVFRLTVTDDDGEAATDDVSVDVAAMVMVPNQPATGAPAIAGTPTVGEDLTASPGTIADLDGLNTAMYAYQWLRGGVVIAGATDDTYTLVSADEGALISVRATFTDDAGHDESRTSAETAAIAAAATTNRVTITLPVHSEFQTNRLRWQDNTNGLGDVSSLLAVAGTEALSRFQTNGSGADASNACHLRTLGGAELNTDFEGYVSAITVEVAGLEDLVMAGPASSLHTTDDASEPYQFTPGDDYTNGAISYLYSANDQPAGLAAWVEDFKAAYAADNSIRATLILDDGS